MARRRRKRKLGTKRGSGGLGLSTVTWLAFIFFSLILTAVVYFGQGDLVEKVRTQRTAFAESAVERSAARLSQAINYYRQGLQIVARSSETRTALNAGIAQARLRMDEIRAMFPGTQRVRFLSGSGDSVDKSTAPAFGFACQDQLRSLTVDDAPVVEMHVPGTKHEHIDIIAAIPSHDGKRIDGYLQLALEPSLLQSWMQNSLQEQAYLELNQEVKGVKPFLLAKGGNVEHKNGTLSARAAIPGTQWALHASRTAGALESGFSLQTLFAVLGGVVVSALCLFWLRRSISSAISHDVTNILHMATDMMRGNQAHGYAFQLKEFKLAAHSIGDVQNQTLERERDDESNSISMASSFNRIDSSLLASDNLIVVEELSGEASMEAHPELTAVKDKSPGQKSSFESSTVTPQPQTVAHIKNNPAAPELPPPEIFKAYDIRGIVGQSLTAKHAGMIGQAIGSEAIKRGLKKIAFARDGRLSGLELGQALVKGLQSTGIDVIDVGMVPTPVLYFAAAELTNGTGVMLTGSHNPPDYNGFKMVLGGDTLSGDAIQSLRERIETKDFTQGQGKYQTTNVAEKYIQRIVGDVRLKRKLKIVIDCGNGVAGAIAPKLFKALGCEVKELFCEVDGNFPNHHPDPSKPENLKDIISIVKQTGADIGLAFDGDGDRLGVISPDGNIIWPDRLMMLFAADVLVRNPGAQIIYDIKCSSNLTRSIFEKGGEPLMWKTGHSLIKRKMKESGALLAGEMSGHIFFKERWYGFDDGLYSGARLLEILAGESRNPKDVFASLPDSVNTPELNVKMAEGEHHLFIDEFMNQAEFGDASVVMIDGVRADYEFGWGLVRASNTTPVLVLRFEGKDDASMKKVMEIFRKQILAVNPALKLPF